MHKQTVASQNVRRLLACMLVAALVAGLLQAALAMPLINFGNGFGSYAADSADAGTDTAADSVPSPCFVKAKASGGTALKISWARVSGASGYVVYRSVGK
jgi:hypothetical protein